MTASDGAGRPTTIEAEVERAERRRDATAATSSRRLAGALGSLVFVLVVNFFLFRVLPGDPARTLGRGRFTTEEQLDAFNETYGLDQPLPQQFVTFLKNTLTGDLGVSLRYRDAGLRPDPRPAVADPPAGRHLDDPGRRDRDLDRDPRSLEPRRHASTRCRPGTSLTLYSMPEWWLGLLLIAVFAVGIGPAPRHLPDRRTALHRRRPLVAGRRARHDLAPRAAGDHADAGLPGRLRADHALLAARRDRRGLPHDRPRQGPARRRRAATARGAQRAAADDHRRRR